ncbi:MAG: CoA transferase [Candidatus Eremiobacteraeota bacterium]|nr:CoA transferase [Candidatus Eremiobacteraeota bacterium]
MKVLELASILAGPAVGYFLAELGADVIKVENPDGGDATRGWKLAGEKAEDGRCAYFCSVNWGKRSLTLDLKRPEDLARLHALLETTDILLANFRPGQAEKLGLPWPDPQRKYPRLITGWITGYGPDNPRPGFDVLIQAESGFLAGNGPVGGPPCRMPVALIDLLTAHQLKEGLLLALLMRERTGQGQMVEVSLWQTALASLANQATNYLMTGFEQQPAGTEHPNLFPYGTLLGCQDGQVFLAVGTDSQFQSLCQALGTPRLAEDYGLNAQRVLQRERLRPLLEAASAGRDSGELLAQLEQLGVPAGRVQSVGRALQGAETLAFEQLAGLRSVAFTGFPKLSLRPPPRLGEHTQEILAGLNY